jgi:hypothetical protein
VNSASLLSPWEKIASQITGWTIPKTSSIGVRHDEIKFRIVSR